MILGNYCSPLTYWKHNGVMHSPAQMSTVGLVCIMCFCPVHAHAVLIDSILVTLRSLEAGTGSMQPWQDHEVSAVRCCVAQQ